MTAAGVGRWACDALSEIGLRCDLQPGHGGNMHSGGNPRMWWQRDGKMVDFGATTPEVMSALEALVLLVDALDAHACDDGNGRPFVKLDWVDDALSDARRVLAEERCESVVG